MRNSRWTALLSCLLLLTILCFAATATNLSVWGKQTRGSASASARLIGEPFVLPETASISSVSCSGNGFWINDQWGNWIVSFYDLNDAIGYKLPSGKYSVFPNLKDNQLEAAVEVTFNY